MEGNTTMVTAIATPTTQPLPPPSFWRVIDYSILERGVCLLLNGSQSDSYEVWVARGFASDISISAMNYLTDQISQRASIDEALGVFEAIVLIREAARQI
jgi:hypothetical protein